MKAFKESFLKHLEEISFFFELRGANPFKIRAYKNAYEIIEGLDEAELKSKICDESLLEIKGIGKGILSVAKEFLKNQSSAEWKEATADLPLSLWELKAVKGLGPKKIQQLYEELQIKTLGELEYALKENRLVDLKSFGEKTQKKLLEEIQKLKGHQGKLILPDALAAAENIETLLNEKFAFLRVGHLGRKLEIIESLDYLVPSDESKKIIPLIKKLSFIGSVIDENNTELKVLTKLGHHIKFIFCLPTEAITQRIYLTSSSEHWNSLKAAALKNNLNLDQNALKKSGKPVRLSSEEQVYSEIGLEYFSEFEREYAISKKSKPTPLTEKDLTGVFHLHTTYSDGTHSLSEMAEAAKQRGWKFMGLSDHSKTAFYAHGLDENALDEQKEEIKRISKKLSPFRILHGIESDILKDGSLDYDEKTLKAFDFVIASIHSRYGMIEMTDRILKAIENPYTTMIGHLTGRLLLAREPYAVDYEKIISSAIKNETIIEFNANPQRLDMDWRFLHDACAKGLLISINPDAHSVEGFEDIKYGIWMARKAGIDKDQIFNTWPYEKILKHLEITA